MKKYFDKLMHKIVHSKNLNKLKDWAMKHIDEDGNFIFFKWKF